MADPIGPIVGTIFQGLQEQVKTQAQYALNFKEQFKEMQTQLELMQAFLNDCKDDKSKCQTVKTASKHLRELTYVADDVVTGCQIREDYKRAIESTFCLPSCKEVVYRWDTGRKLTEINQQLQKMHKRHGLLESVGQRSSKPPAPPRRKTTPLVPHKIVGLEKETEKITNWMFTGNVSFIGITGMGGLGKTTIAQKVFNHKQVKDRFKKRIWVCVAQTYDAVELERSILDMLGVEYKGCNESDLQTKISEFLLANNTLIVLDDVWTLKGGWWTLISTAFQERAKHNGCIIVTSRNKQVIKDMVAHGGFNNVEIHEPKLLSKVESEKLFCKFVFGQTKTKFNKCELDKVGKEIVHKCNGLPLAIKIIGGVMSGVKPRTPAEWRKKCEKFREVIIKKIEGTVSVIDSLQLSYDELPDHLKQCLLCFAIYPDDHEIEVEQLKRWWVGEGFVRGTEIPNEEAYEYLLELINRCLVEVTKKGDFDGRVHKCKMHDMVREMVIRNAKDEAFCDFNNTGKHIATANSLHLGVTKDTSFQSLNGNEKLRALILTTCDSIGFNKRIALAKVKTLRVLDLSRLKLDGISVDHLWHWITSLKLLAYLNLQDVVGLEEIPPSIQKLWGLQILILNGCESLGSLPSPMPCFPRLKVLDVRNCSSRLWIPQGLSTLSTLQELYGFKIPKGNEKEACGLDGLKEMKQLEVLHVDIMKGSLIQGHDLTALGSLEKLRVLSINANGITDDELLQKLKKLCVPSGLKHLYLRRFCLEDTPAWISPSSLPQLQFLCIEDSKELTQFSENFHEGQWMVEGMSLKFLPKLEVELEWLQKAMPQLRYLEVSHCNTSKSSTFLSDDLYTWEQPNEEEMEEDKELEHNAYEEDKEEECNTRED
ncbi:PREDICTED: disease resistance RPP13-like protein 4 [Ipomoea nil]|uniref:disease resistance RPP13-like protein 4 n=1 Tax=Ipomoea nil TaxID=35883 RepID=UPI0009015DFE|nr:PREDICTED: disease resistance RPP13-like protein 4 [Ipomoea nil]XP_019194045.1 PREDICTED: disease resistance RPP13-like protein 4 [Ipomoea nil]XP_019194046.1 PREDICTED: disease resistance RPP13-like protein 4 [Ipomoea nil]